MRVLSYYFFSCLEGACCHHAGWGTAEVVTRAPEHGRSRCGRSPSLGGILSGSGNLGGQLFTAPTDVSHFFFFFFSPMETLNHVSAYPVIYIGHDSYQGGLQLPAQTHQPGHLFPTKSCPWEPQMKCFRSAGRVFHLWPEEEGFPRPEWSRVESGKDTIRRLGCTPFWRNHTELSSRGAILCHSFSGES